MVGVPHVNKIGSASEPVYIWDLSEVDEEWKPYMRQLELFLRSQKISVEEFYDGLVEYNKEFFPEEFQEILDEQSSFDHPEEPDFTPPCSVTLHQHWLDLSETEVNKIPDMRLRERFRALLNRETLYQIWLYFCQTDSVAHRVLGIPSMEVEQTSFSPTDIKIYSKIYKKHFRYLFRAFILSQHEEKQIMFVCIQGDNRQHLLLRKCPDTDYSAYDITSDMGIELATQFNTDELLYTQFTVEE